MHILYDQTQCIGSQLRMIPDMCWKNEKSDYPNSYPKTAPDTLQHSILNVCMEPLLTNVHVYCACMRFDRNDNDESSRPSGLALLETLYIGGAGRLNCPA
jgi:hypothetical protein